MRIYVAAVAGFVTGVVLWSHSQALTGKLQPWNATSASYLASLFAAGLLLGVIEHESFWVGPLGVYLGQAAVVTGRGLLLSPAEQPVNLALVPLFLISFSLPSIVAAAVSAAAIRWRERP